MSTPKKLKKSFYLWLRKHILHPWALRNAPEVSHVLHDKIVFQMWGAGISIANINKWLSFRRLPTIKHYTVEKNGYPRLFYKHLTHDEKTEIKSEIKNVA